jgi:hypothetical protein
MCEYLLDHNEIIINDEYKPKLFRPITKDNILLINEDSHYKKLYQNNNLHVFIYTKNNNKKWYEIEVLLIYKNKYNLYLSYYYDKPNINRGLFKIGSMTIFKKENRCIEFIDNFRVMYLYTIEEILRNILNDINSLDINMSYYKLLSILKDIPIIGEIYNNFENIYQLLPLNIKNRDIFSIIADYI